MGYNHVVHDFAQSFLILKGTSTCLICDVKEKGESWKLFGYIPNLLNCEPSEELTRASEGEMGNGATKEEQLYQAVQNGNCNAIKVLRHDGAVLEFVDKEGRTPLILACTRGDLFDVVLTLLNLGANIKAYQPGTHGGVPLHQAAKNGLDRTVFLLLSRGADPLAVNDDALTPLDLARNRGHLAVVRMIEDRISVFRGMVRELAGPGFLTAFAPQWVTKKIWVVVVPTESDPRKLQKFELVIYPSPKNPLPRTIISLVRAEVEEPKFSSPDPILAVTDKQTKTKYKFQSEASGDKAQLEHLYRVCKGLPQIAAGAGRPGMPTQAVLQGLSTLIQTANQQHPVPANNQVGPSGASATSSHGPSDVALKMAMDASLRTASEEEALVGELRENGFGGWGNGEKGSNFNGWGTSTEAGPSNVASEPLEEYQEELVPEAGNTLHLPVQTQESSPIQAAPAAPAIPSTSLSPPSAPPLPAEYTGPIHYPSVDTTPVEIDYSAIAPHEEVPASAPKAPAAEETGGQCVICWDAPAQGVCIPCGHLAGCMDCLSEIKAKDWGCPVCRASIQQVIKVYAV